MIEQSAPRWPGTLWLEAGEVESTSDSLAGEGAVVPDAQPCYLLAV